MKLVIISMAIYFVFKSVYGHWGDYESDYWSAVYYAFKYALTLSLLLFVHKRCLVKLQRWSIRVGLLYFGFLMLLHMVCLFKISLYRTLISHGAYIGVDIVVLTIGILFINFLSIKSHVSKT